MHQKKYFHLLIALGVFLVLLLTFFWCIVDNILTGAEMANAGFVTSVTAVTIIGALLWLSGHGLHGAAVIALPALILRRPRTKEEVYAN